MWKKIQINKILLLISFSFAFIAYSLWEPLNNYLVDIVGEKRAEKISSFFFFFNLEFAFVGYTYLIYRYMLKEGEIWGINISKFIFISAFGALIDRVFFDPYIISTNDYILYTINFLYLIYYAYDRSLKNY